MDSNVGALRSSGWFSELIVEVSAELFSIEGTLQAPVYSGEASE